MNAPDPDGRGRSWPSLVGADEISVYPFDNKARLPGHYFLPLEFTRYLNSRFFANASWEVKGVAMALVCISQNQRPIGTLPCEVRELAYELRISEADLERLCELRYGPLYGWEKCLCGNEVRLFHPVVLDLVDEATKRRTKQDASTETDAVRKRRQRMRDAMAALGCAAGLLDDAELINRMDHWLTASGVRKRTDQHYTDALDHAHKSGWFNRD